MKRSKRKNEIYSAAVRLFRERGYAASSMRDIAERVGIEASSLYSHISSKEEILRDICMDCSEMFEAGMKEVLATEGPFLQKIQALMRLHIDMAINHPSSVTVFNDEWKHLPPASLEKFLASRRAYEAAYRNIIKEGMAAGEFAQRSSKVVFNIIINSTQWLHYYPRKLSKDELEKFERNIFSFIEAGIMS